MSFYERYEKCCKEKGILPKSQFSANSLGCTKSYIISLEKSGKAPSGSIVASAAKMLDVSADYLLEIVDIPRNIHIEYSTNELNILSNIKKLNNNSQECAIAMIDGLLRNEKFIKK